MIEAKWLFGLKPDQIDVIVHPQSIIHSIVQFEDGAMKAQMGLPDMRLPIQFALGYPKRMVNAYPRFDFLDYPTLQFEKVDTRVFQNLALAQSALKQGGNMPCVLNAANEVAVAAFLKENLRFIDISDVIARCMEKVGHISRPNLEDYLSTDQETRVRALEIIG